MRERSVGLDWKNQSISINQSRFFVHLFAAVARRQRENTYFHVLSRTGTLIQSFRIANILRIKQDGISAIKFEAARIHFLSDVFVAVAVTRGGLNYQVTI